MPSLFHRRSRSLSTQRLQAAPASSNAHLAASQAFLNNRVSQGNLSASAAAAALRAMSPPPTDVGDVQTKRMQRRASSTASPTAARGRSRGGGLERTASSGSMTERTFRSPSPGRPASRDGPGEAPPVPKLPEDIPPVPKLKERRSKRSVSENTRPTANQQSPVALSPALAAATISARPNGGQLQRMNSSGSINFSYPRPQSPPPQSPASPQAAAPPSPAQQKPTRNGISLVDSRNVEYNVTAASQQPVKKKKKRVAPGAAEGSHLSAGSMASKPVVTPLEQGPEITTPQQQPVKKKKKKIAPTGASSHFPASESEDAQESELTAEQQRRAQRASGVLMKQPSVVREDWEGEQDELDTNTAVQQREAQGLSPVASPAAVIQSKKTTAANMSKKIEEPASPTPKQDPETFNALVTETPAQPDTNLLTVNQPSAERQLSRSPSRTTRFSDNLASDLSTERKHEPLPRSVSPVKSALKHHSPSPVGGRLARGQSPSEASDSNQSADGSVRRRKSQRVSFEPEAEVVGVAADPVEQDSPVVVSPQNKEPKKTGFFGLGRSRPQLTTIPSEEDLDEHMKPRPQLPSFGSVRNKSRRVDSSDSVAATPTSTPEKLLSSLATQTSSTSSSSSSLTTRDQGLSNDHAVGALLAQHADQKSTPQAQTLPLPPVVTSREGGYISESESNYSDDDMTPTPAQDSKQLHQQTPVAGAPKTAHEAAVLKDVEAERNIQATLPADKVPGLALHPPTPGEEDDKPADQWLVDVPGGFPGAVVNRPKSTAFAQAEAEATSQANAAESKRTFGPSQAELAREKAAAPVLPVEEEEDDEEASDNDSIYSDAAEEPEGDGFGSINAIVGSPIPPSPVNSTPPQSPLGPKSDRRPAEAARAASWDDTHEHWRGIAQQTRQIQTTPPQQATRQLQEATATPPAVPTPAPKPAAATTTGNVAPANKPKPKKKKSLAASGAALAAIPVSQRPQAPEAKPQISMKTSMRQGSQTADLGRGSGSLRSSMRQQREQPHAKSLQASKWASGPDRPKSQVQPIPPPAATSRAALQKKHIPPAAGASAPKAPRPAPVANGNDSDSDSSFKKARKNKRSAEGAYNMRRSMRGAPEASATAQPASRVRSLSPPVRRPFSPAPGAGSMRTSMRGSMDTATPTLRQPPPQKRSSSLLGFRKAKSPERGAPLPLTSKIRSRIGDSDDEDEARPTVFRSRFADSSDDEDDVQPLRPVRGIPKRQDDGDSTDLEDSSDEEKKRKRSLQPAIKIDTAAAQKSAPAADVPLSPNTMKKKGLFSRFRSKKQKDEIPQTNGHPGSSVTSSPAPAKKTVSKEDDTPFDENMGFGSGAERDAMIRQTMAKLEAAKSAEAPVTPPPKTSQTAAPPARPQSPDAGSGGRLQRRRPERVMSDSWPLPESPVTPVGSNSRPATSAGPAGKQKINGMSTMRPPNERRPTSESYTDASGAVLNSKGKKKRFPMLRKAFGLKD